jgi:ACR3 family arsenite transporter
MDCSPSPGLRIRAVSAGNLSRSLGGRARGREWYESRFLPKIGPIALYGLLFTIVLLFALQGETITSQPLDVARIALPLLVYFAVMWAGSYALGKAAGLGYARTTTVAFTAAGNNFESPSPSPSRSALSASPPARRSPVWSAPLIEVPVLVALVYEPVAPPPLGL